VEWNPHQLCVDVCSFVSLTLQEQHAHHYII